MTGYTYLNSLLPGHICSNCSSFSQSFFYLHGLKVQVSQAKALVSPCMAMPLQNLRSYIRNTNIWISLFTVALWIAKAICSYITCMHGRVWVHTHLIMYTAILLINDLMICTGHCWKLVSAVRSTKHMHKNTKQHNIHAQNRTINIKQWQQTYSYNSNINILSYNKNKSI